MTVICTDRQQLSKPCDPCEPKEGFGIIDQLAKALDESPVLGIGLAANQIGIQKQVCLLRFPETDPQGFGYSVEIPLINPTITALAEPVIFDREGCLSFPGQYVKTLRYARCTVVDHLEPTGRELVGLRAICAQHEIDHLLGRTMYDSLWSQIGPNETCRCKSGKKFKHCCRLVAKDWK